jgi:hypothetical protein
MGRPETAVAEAMARAEAAYDAVPATAVPDMGDVAGLPLRPVRAGFRRAPTAVRWLSGAVARCDEHHFAGPRRLALSLLATAHAWLGDPEASAAAVVELDNIPAMEFARPDHEFAGVGPEGRLATSPEGGTCA